MKRYITLVFLLFIFFPLSFIVADPIFPTAYNGRFRPIDATARLWLYDFHHAQKLKSSSVDANTVLWNFFLHGHDQYDDVPLIWIHYATLKNLLNINTKQDRFSYNQLHKALYSTNNAPLMNVLLSYFFAKNYLDPHNRSQSDKQELKQLTPGLWVALKNEDLVVEKQVQTPPWNHLKQAQILVKNARSALISIERREKPLAEEALRLLSILNQYKEWKGIQNNATHEKTMSLTDQLRESGTLIKALPSKTHPGEWYSLKALDVKVYHPETNTFHLTENFTPYSHVHFEAIRAEYEHLKKMAQTKDKNQIDKSITSLGNILDEAYATIAGTSYQQAFGKNLTYPSLNQLKAEQFYYRYPLIEIAMLFYAIAAITFLLNLTLKNKRFTPWGIGFLALAFFIHTAVLVLRCYILQRPPVSNMFETVIYVPWIASIVSFTLWITSKTEYAPLLLLASSLTSLALLILLQITQINSNLDNVQAVLDSQYWLIVHVLLVVGSYGVFILSGFLGQIYLFSYVLKVKDIFYLNFLGKFILQTLYLGVAMLIPGTILGGVWAAESWGRFWDWDPKESWAFISSCIYLIWIHAYRLGKIAYFGLAVGSVVGLLAISFTWYGVNYILGTGLHSYGFGSGGEIYYYSFLIVQILFLCAAFLIHKNRISHSL